MAAPIIVNDFTEFKQAWDDALLIKEDTRIEVLSDIEFDDVLTTLNHGYQITVATAPTVDICRLTASGLNDQNFRHFFIQGGLLVLENIIVAGSLNVLDDWTYGGIEVRSGGTLRMRQGSVIENCKGRTGGGIWVKEGGSFLMTSGQLRNCLGEGIAFGNLIFVNGNFELRNGHLSYTTANHYNGVHISESGTFTMIGGFIEHCVTGIFMEQESDLRLSGGIIRNSDTAIEADNNTGRKIIVMNGGELTNNRVGVMVAEGCEFTFNEGEIFGNLGKDGIGILCIYGNRGRFVMNGGQIHHNVQGIAWQQTNITCIINDGEIYENGYGIAIDNAVVSMNNGKIHSNRIYGDDVIRPIINPTLGGYPISGMGVMAGFGGTFNFINGEIYNNERIGIVAIFNGTLNMKAGTVYQNLIGLQFILSQGVMASGEVYGNRVAGVEVANVQDFDDSEIEHQYSVFKMDGGKIYNNLGDGVQVKDGSRFILNAGEIHGHRPGGMGVYGRNLAKITMNGGRIYNNYKAFDLFAKANPAQPDPNAADATLPDTGTTLLMTGGKIDENTVGVALWNFCGFVMEDGEICNNYGTRAAIVAATGGLGVGIRGSKFTMHGGSIFGHRGFPAHFAIGAFGQSVGAAITILFHGEVEITGGSITDNEASVGAAIFVPFENYNQVIISDQVYFEKNRARDDLPSRYSGGNQHVDTNIFFASTSIGAHILNNYDINYQSGQRITTRIRDYFPDEAFASVIAEILGLTIDDYVVQEQLDTITVIEAAQRGIKSIAGSEHLTKLETIDIDENKISDLSPLANLEQLKHATALNQRLSLPQIYVSRLFHCKVIDKDATEIGIVVFKYNGNYTQGDDHIIWWERGRNEVNWTNEEGTFTGVGTQVSIPIPIEYLFEDSALAHALADVLNKMISSPIDITELLRLVTLDLSARTITKLEGMQFLFNLKYLNLKDTSITADQLELLSDLVDLKLVNLKGTGITATEAASYLGSKVKVLVD